MFSDDGIREWGVESLLYIFSSLGVAESGLRPGMPGAAEHIRPQGYFQKSGQGLSHLFRLVISPLKEADGVKRNGNQAVKPEVIHFHLQVIEKDASEEVGEFQAAPEFESEYPVNNGALIIKCGACAIKINRGFGTIRASLTIDNLVPQGSTAQGTQPQGQPFKLCVAMAAKMLVTRQKPLTATNAKGRKKEIQPISIELL